MKRSTTLQRIILGAIAFVVVWSMSLGSGDPFTGALYGLIAGVAVFFVLSFIFGRNQDSFRMKVENALAPFVDTTILTGCAAGFTGAGRSILIMELSFLGWLIDKILNERKRTYYFIGTTPDRLVILQRNQTAPKFYRRDEVKALSYSGIDLSENVLHIELPEQALDIRIEAGAGRTVAEAMVSAWHSGKPVRDDSGKLLKTT